MATTKSIRVRVQTYARLKKLRQYRRESIDDVLTRVLDVLQGRTSGPLPATISSSQSLKGGKNK